MIIIVVQVTDIVNGTSDVARTNKTCKMMHFAKIVNGKGNSDTALKLRILKT